MFLCIRCSRIIIGRPFIIVLVQSRLTNENIAFINVHAGHGERNSSSKIIRRMEQQCQQLMNNKIINRYIMAGDFNRDVTNNGSRSITFNNTKLWNISYPRPNTCCINDKEGIHIRESDHILDSNNNFKTHEYSDGKYPSSDHAWVYAELDSTPLKQPSMAQSRYKDKTDYHLRVSMDMNKPNKKLRSQKTINSKTTRKHQAIHQSGGNKGRLKKGYKYSGKKLKSGLPQIVKCKSKIK